MESGGQRQSFILEYGIETHYSRSCGSHTRLYPVILGDIGRRHKFRVVKLLQSLGHLDIPQIDPVILGNLE